MPPGGGGGRSTVMMSWIDASRASTRVDIWFTEVGSGGIGQSMSARGPRGGSGTYFARGSERTHRRIWLRVVQVTSRPVPKSTTKIHDIHIHSSTNAFKPVRVRRDVQKRSTRAGSRYRSVRGSSQRWPVSSRRSRSDLRSSESCWEMVRQGR
jgi:hypothetical protein